MRKVFSLKDIEKMPENAKKNFTDVQVEKLKDLAQRGADDLFMMSNGSEWKLVRAKKHNGKYMITSEMINDIGNQPSASEEPNPEGNDEILAEATAALDNQKMTAGNNMFRAIAVFMASPQNPKYEQLLVKTAANNGWSLEQVVDAIKHIRKSSKLNTLAQDVSWGVQLENAFRLASLSDRYITKLKKLLNIKNIEKDPFTFKSKFENSANYGLKKLWKTFGYNKEARIEQTKQSLKTSRSLKDWKKEGFDDLFNYAYALQPYTKNYEKVASAVSYAFNKIKRKNGLNSKKALTEIIKKFLRGDNE